MKSLTKVLAIALLIACSVPSAPAQTPDVKTLKGIDTVFVLVENLQDGAKVIGLSGDVIQTDVELKLRLAGMRVVTQEEGYNVAGSPNIYVSVTLTDGAEAAAIVVSLDQNAFLERNRELAIGAETWNKGMVMSHPTAQTIRDAVKDKIDQFLNDWLSVNPKK